MKIFGREPALVLAFIASGIMVFSQFVYPLTVDQQGGLNATCMALVGIITLFTVAEDGGLALIVGLAKAVLALALAFRLNLDPGAQAVVMAFVTVTAQLFVRSNVVAPLKADGSSSAGKSIDPFVEPTPVKESR